MAPARGWSPIAVTVLALVAVNLASNRLVPAVGYVPFAVASTLLLVAVARRMDRLSWRDLGMDPTDAPSGLRWGGAIVGAIAVGYLVGFWLPATADLFRDERVEDLSFTAAAAAALVRVPLGTVLLEEVAFRSVLPAVLAQRMRLRWAVAWSSLAFGLWHVLPAMGLADVNPVADDTVGQLPGWITVAAAVAATTVVGVVLCWLRYRSRSVLAPMLVHWSTNGLGYLFAWWAWNR